MESVVVDREDEQQSSYMRCYQLDDKFNRFLQMLQQHSHQVQNDCQVLQQQIEIETNNTKQYEKQRHHKEKERLKMFKEQEKVRKIQESDKQKKIQEQDKLNSIHKEIQKMEMKKQREEERKQRLEALKQQNIKKQNRLKQEKLEKARKEAADLQRITRTFLDGLYENIYKNYDQSEWCEWDPAQQDPYQQQDGQQGSIKDDKYDWIMKHIQELKDEKENDKKRQEMEIQKIRSQLDDQKRQFEIENSDLKKQIKKMKSQNMDDDGNKNKNRFNSPSSKIQYKGNHKRQISDVKANSDRKQDNLFGKQDDKQVQSQKKPSYHRRQTSDLTDLRKQGDWKKEANKNELFQIDENINYGKRQTIDLCDLKAKQSYKQDEDQSQADKDGDKQVRPFEVDNVGNDSILVKGNEKNKRNKKVNQREQLIDKLINDSMRMKQQGTNGKGQQNQNVKKYSSKVGSIYFKKNTHQKDIYKINEDFYGKRNKYDQNTEYYEKPENNDTDLKEDQEQRQSEQQYDNQEYDHDYDQEYDYGDEDGSNQKQSKKNDQNDYYDDLNYQQQDIDVFKQQKEEPKVNRTNNRQKISLNKSMELQNRFQKNKQIQNQLLSPQNMRLKQQQKKKNQNASMIAGKNIQDLYKKQVTIDSSLLQDYQNDYKSGKPNNLRSIKTSNLDSPKNSSNYNNRYSNQNNNQSNYDTQSNQSSVNESKETQELKQRIEKVDRHLKFDPNFDYYKHLQLLNQQIDVKLLLWLSHCQENDQIVVNINQAVLSLLQNTVENLEKVQNSNFNWKKISGLYKSPMNILNSIVNYSNLMILEKIRPRNIIQSSQYFRVATDLMLNDKNISENVNLSQLSSSLLKEQIKRLLGLKKPLNKKIQNQTDNITFNNCIKLYLFAFNAIMLYFQYNQNKELFIKQTCYVSPVVSPKMAGNSKNSNKKQSPLEKSFRTIENEQKNKKTNVFFNRSQTQTEIKNKKQVQKYLESFLNQQNKVQQNNDIENQQELVSNYYNYVNHVVQCQVKQKDYEQTQKNQKKIDQAQKIKEKKNQFLEQKQSKIVSDIEQKAYDLEISQMNKDSELFYQNTSVDNNLREIMRQLEKH